MTRFASLVRERGPMTVAAFMDLALYDPRAGYYARAAQRSGRAGDFFTSVDVGPLFGELLEVQIAEMASLLHTSDFNVQRSTFKVRGSTFNVQRSMFNVQRSMFNVQRSMFKGFNLPRPTIASL